MWTSYLEAPSVGLFVQHAIACSTAAARQKVSEALLSRKVTAAAVRMIYGRPA